MIGLLLSPAGRAVGALLLAAAVLGGVAAAAYQRGAAAERQATLERAVEAYHKREEIDDEVERTDPVGICVALGGLPDDCRDQLRRVEEAAKAE